MPLRRRKPPDLRPARPQLWRRVVRQRTDAAAATLQSSCIVMSSSRRSTRARDIFLQRNGVDSNGINIQ